MRILCNEDEQQSLPGREKSHLYERPELNVFQTGVVPLCFQQWCTEDIDKRLKLEFSTDDCKRVTQQEYTLYLRYEPRMDGQ